MKALRNRPAARSRTTDGQSSSNCAVQMEGAAGLSRIGKRNFSELQPSRYFHSRLGRHGSPVNPAILWALGQARANTKSRGLHNERPFGALTMTSLLPHYCAQLLSLHRTPSAGSRKRVQSSTVRNTWLEDN